MRTRISSLTGKRKTRFEADLIVSGASEVFVGPAASTPVGAKIIPDGAVACADGTIQWVGLANELEAHVDTGRAVVIDAAGKTVLPGLIDPHTHMVYEGSRELEIEMRAKGTGYKEVLGSGGGIMSTVRETRTASSDKLVKDSLARLWYALSCGTTCVEIKSGYGLDLESELKILGVIKILGELWPGTIVPTFLGAHVVPEEFSDRREAYLELLLTQMLPEVGRKRLARYCDVFCETGVFSPEESELILRIGMEHRLRPKLHADELTDSKGAALAARVRAVSADHLVRSSDDGLCAMAERGVVAVVLPVTSLCLNSSYADVRKMLDFGLTVAFATDSNPGTAPNQNPQLVLNLACYQLGMTPAEAILGMTINAAKAVEKQDLLGSIEPGKQADLVIFDVPNHRQIPYWLGENRVETVVCSGRIVWDRNQPAK